MRDNTYLYQRIQEIWSRYFQDVPKSNHVFIQFGPRAQKRLGSIRRCNVHSNSHFDTLIMVNGHFRDPKIPESVIDATIAHELCHYAHGFSSPLPQLSRFPHRGGIIEKEILNRGLKPLIDKEDIWLNRNWLNYLSKNNKKPNN